jgi:ABC-type multidrug transport system permease subunit
MKEELAVPFPKELNHRAALSTEKYSVSKRELLKANYDKQWLLMKRNAIVYIFMIMQLAVGAFISMTVFFRTRLHQRTISDGTTYLGALFYAVVSIMFNGFGDLAIMISRLPVLIKQRDLLFYPAWSYSLSTVVLSIPVTLLQSVVWVTMTYYVTGYAPEASRFFKQMLLLFLMGQTAGSMFRLIAALCRTMVLANTVGFVFILLSFMLGGFVVPRPSIKKWWIWGYWISPLTYAQQAISVNEMLAPRWSTVGALEFLPPTHENTAELHESCYCFLDAFSQLLLLHEFCYCWMCSDIFCFNLFPCLIMFKFPGSMQIPPGTTKTLGVQVLESRGQFPYAYWYCLQYWLHSGDCFHAT